MAWVAQKALDEAVAAMMAASRSLTSHDSSKLKILHPSQSYDQRKWENVICAMLALANTTPDVVVPEGTYLFQKDYGNAA